MKCQICKQKTDFVCTSFRNKPFVDGKNYTKICFGCAWVPKQLLQHYKEDGSVDYEEGPFFSYQHLCTAKELFEQQSAETISEAKRCVSAVKSKIKEVGIRALKKLNLKRPNMQYELE